MILDSGAGGLSIAKEIRGLLPKQSLCYVADDAAFPYGNRTSQDVTARVIDVVGVAVRQLQPSLIVLGCNTASTQALEHLRSCYDIPFVGVVPAIKPASQISRSKHIGVLATPGTVNTPYLQQLVKAFAEHCTVYKHGSKVLAQLAEQKFAGIEPDTRLIEQELKCLMDQPGAKQLDTVVLACTHFPLLKEEITAVCPAGIQWIDSGKAIARRVEQLLKCLPSLDTTSPREHRFYQTGNSRYQADRIEPYLGQALYSHLTLE